MIDDVWMMINDVLVMLDVGWMMFELCLGGAEVTPG